MFGLYKRLLIIIVVVLALGGLQEGKAQDARFAQFYASPLQQNPALTGVFVGQTRLVANYRELYNSILGSNRFRTLSASVDFRVPVSRRGDDYFGVGLVALRDDAGESNFTRNQVALSGAFLKEMGGRRGRYESQYLSAGIQLGVAQRGFDSQKLWFSQQFFVDEPNRTAYVDQGLSSGEIFGGDLNTGMYLDFSAGILYYATFDQNQSFYIGGSMYHISEPNISILDENPDLLYRRYVGQIGGEVPFTDAFSILPAATVYSQGPSMSATFGANLRYNAREWKEVAIRAGLWGHMSNQLDDQMTLDALIFSAILETEQLQFGLSYDITTSVLASVNNSRGAFELSVIYVNAPRLRKRGVTCPKF